MSKRPHSLPGEVSDVRSLGGDKHREDAALTLTTYHLRLAQDAGPLLPVCLSVCLQLVLHHPSICLSVYLSTACPP